MVLRPRGRAHRLVADTRLNLKAGGFAFGPKGVPHTFYAEAGGAKVLVGFAPMQFEGFQREVGPRPRARPAPADGGPAGHGEARSDRPAKRVRDPRPPRPTPRPLTTSKPPAHTRPLKPSERARSDRPGEDLEPRHHHTHRRRPLHDRRPREQYVDADGNDYDLTGQTTIFLCRCGNSGTKPFCDGTHETLNFEATSRAPQSLSAMASIDRV